MNRYQTPRGATRGLPILAAALLLALCVCLLASAAVPVSASGVSFFQPQLDKLVGWGVMQGYPDGSLAPDNPITRAEFVALVNRAYGFREPAVTPFTDVPAGAWYAEDIGIAYKAGYYLGSTATTASPDSYLTREQALVLLARNMRMAETPGEVSEFSDGREFDAWSRGYVRSALQKGIITGYEDGSFRPKNTITRGEMAAMLTRSLGTLVAESGPASLGEVFGNVTLSRPDTTLQDTTVAGDLYISGGLGLGSMTLENVDVLGEIIIAGGGESNAGESVILRNTKADNLVVDALGGQYLSLRSEGDTRIPTTSVNSDAFIHDRTPSGEGLQKISLDNGQSFTVAGNVESVVNNVPNSSLIVGAGAVQDLVMGETAVGSTLNVDAGAMVRNLNLDTGVAVTGTGDVDKLNVNTAGSSSEMLPDSVDIRPGIKATVAGTEMDTATARQATEEPRILAGYPKISNLAPTSARATYAANKAGRVYWAISAVADGSVNEADLITPPTYGTRVVKSGNIRVNAANTEQNVNITGLVTGSNYYLSSIMVDERGVHSAVKVISFSTPDNTVPNFAGGTPVISRNTYDQTSGVYTVQAMVIPTKSCKLYWALYPRGSVTPTAAEFRAGTLPGALAFNTLDVTRNQEEYIRLHNFYNLTELTTYNLYVWLNDADNGQSSQIRTVTFTTVDGTPPVFQVRPTVTNVTNNAIRLTANVNEAATIYWVAVLGGEDYPKAPSGGGLLTEDYAVIQVTNGMNGIRSGSVRARANADVTINVNGLQPETTYDIWYVAVDSSGNHSAFVISGPDRSCITSSTLDTNPPRVTQEFTRFEAAGPYTDTDVRLVFSERIQHIPNARDADLNLAQPLELYNIITDSTRTQTERNAARYRLGKVLKDMIGLYSGKRTGVTSALADREHNADGSIASPSADWYIDYYNATVTMESGKMVITFPTTSGSDSALNLRSGASYFFRIQNVCDMSNNQNVMPTTTLDTFTTISAQVEINDPTAASATITYNNRNVEADLYFTLHPIGTTQVDDSVNWDLLFWTDSYISFELYSKPHTGTQWTRVGSTEITRTTAEKGFLARSLHQYLEPHQDSHPINSELPVDTDYVVHITALRGNTERDVWSQDVKFRVSVITGTVKDVPAFTGKTITEAQYTAAVGATISDIGLPVPFERTAPFNDKTVPTFTDNYPIIVPADVSAVLTVQLNHPGTVYYVIAPAENGPITTQRIDGNPAHYDDADIPHTFNGARTGSLLELSAPSTIDVYDPTYTNKSIVSGSINIDSRSSPTEAISVTVNGLTAKTKYFLYTVEKGPSSDPSERVQLFKFETQEMIRPQYWLTLQNPRVQISTNMTTNVSYMVLNYDQTTLRNTILWNELDSTRVASGMAPPTKTGGGLYRLYEAICTSVNNTDPTNHDTIFDLYASDTTKDQVAQYIRNIQPDGSRIIASATTSVRTAGTTVNPSTNMSKGAQYIFLAVGNSVQGGITSADSFRGIYPLGLIDNTPPEITGINITDLTFSEDGTQVTGSLRVFFDESLFYLDNTGASLGQTLPLDLSDTTLAHARQSQGYVGYATINPDAGSGLSVITTGTKNQSIDAITFITGSSTTGTGLPTTTGSMYQLNRMICDQYSNTLGYNPIVELNLTRTATTVTAVATVTLNANGTRKLTSAPRTYNLPQTPVTKITLDPPTALVIPSTATEGRQVTAAIEPADATDKTLTWGIRDENIAKIASSGDGYVTIVPVSVGETILTATASGGSARATITIRVSEVVNALNVSPTTLTMRYGETQTLQATTNPDGANVTWAVTSGSNYVALTNTTGSTVTIQAIGMADSGSATAEVTATSGNLTSSCIVTVTGPDISLNQTSLTLTTGAEYQLSVTANPASSVRTVTWESSDSTVATVNPGGTMGEGGLVTGAVAGTATITATVTLTNGKTQKITCTVTVTQSGG